MQDDSAAQRPPEHRDMALVQTGLETQSELRGCVYECAHTAPEHAVLVEAVVGDTRWDSEALGEGMAKDNLDDGFLKVDFVIAQENSFGFDVPENQCQECFDIETLYAADFSLDEGRVNEVATSSTSVPLYEIQPASSEPARKYARFDFDSADAEWQAEPEGEADHSSDAYEAYLNQLLRSVRRRL